MENTIKRMSLSKKQGKAFWKYLDKLSNKQTTNYVKNIPLSRWQKYFENILCDKQIVTYPQDCQEGGPLDYEITSEELNDASYILRNGKATGLDMISNEMLKCILETNPQVLLKVFNSTLQHNPEILEWCTSLLAPIHKKGSQTNPENYRGISLISCVNKLFSAILNKRLHNYCTSKGILSEEQLGFMPGNRTSDAHFLMHNLIQEHCHKQGNRLYACFIDFSKAFDTIPRVKLFQKLLAHGVNGKFFNILKSMYMNDKCRVKVGNHLSEIINPNRGVRQGCVLSPLLFNIFLADLPAIMNSAEHEQPGIGEGKNLSCLLWADDLILISKTEEGLAKMLSKLSEYSGENSLCINTDKTKCMIFNKNGRLIRRNFKIGDTIINTVREYKYLGFVVTPSGEINSGLKDLRSRANRAITLLRRKLGVGFRMFPDTTEYLFDTLIKPIILYMSDFWGCFKLPINNPIDKIQNSFLKQLLGVQIQTTTVGILLETGNIPLTMYAQKACIKNWDRIAVKNNCNNLVNISYKNSLQQCLTWPSRIQYCLSSIGMQNIFLHGNNCQQSTENLFLFRSMDIFHQNSFAELDRENSKLRTYKLLKTEIGREPYLNHIRNIEDRMTLTKFRLSNHNLMIEKGRHQNIPRNLRYCPFCPGKIEDEIHFLVKCKCFDAHRKSLYEKAMTGHLTENFLLKSDIEKFKMLMTDLRILPLTAKYLRQAFYAREFIISKHKNNM